MIGFVGAIAATLINLVLLVIVWTRNTKNPIHQTFALISLSLFIWNFFSIFAQYYHIKLAGELSAADRLFLTSRINLFFKLNSIGLVFLPTAVLHFVIAFANFREPALKWLLGFAYCLSTLFLLSLVTPIAISKLWTYAFCGFQLPAYIFAAYLLYKFYRNNQSRLERHRIRSLLVGAIIGMAGGLTDALPAFGIQVSLLGNFANAFYSIIIAYTIVKYKLFGITEMTRTILSLIIMTVLFFSISISFRTLANGPLFYIWALLAAVFIIIIYQPAHSGLKRFTAALFANGKDYAKALQEFNVNVAVAEDSYEIAEIVNKAVQAIQISQSLIALKDKEKFYLFSEKGKPAILSNSLLSQALFKNEQPLVKEELVTRIRLSDDAPQTKNMLDSIVNSLESLGAEVSLPLKFKENLIGLLFVREKIKGGLFTAEDLSFLSLIAVRVALVLESHRIQTEKERNKHLETLGRMVSAVSHEIKNPLGSIKGAAQYLETEMGHNEFLTIILEETDRLNKLVTEFLDFARPMRLHTQFMSLTRVLDKSIELLNNKKVTFHKEYFASLPPLNLDPDLMKQVFLNLFLNSIQAMSEGGDIFIRTTLPPENHFVEVKIFDTGQGFSPEMKDLIWTPFYTTKKSGAGLGLAIVRQIVAAHQGTIEIESRLGEGTTVTLCLPWEKND